MAKPTIGFIGQGFVGKNMADSFEEQGYQTIRYSLEEPHVRNKDRIKEADVVFIAVPTPTRPTGFDFSILQNEIALVGVGKIVVIKSTIVPGTTRKIQEAYPDRIVLNSPEFLQEVTAAYDARNPFFNIVGMPLDSDKHRKAAELVLSILPKTPYANIVASEEAELIKYAHNGSGYTQIIFFNLMYDLAKQIGANWQPIEEALSHDPLISNKYSKPVHKSGRGAGGHCFPKDFEALLQFYRERVKDETGIKALESIRDKNLELLRSTGKDADILAGIYNSQSENAQK